MELDVLSGLLVRFCSEMHVQGFLARRGVLELAIQSNLYGSLYVIFAEGGAIAPLAPPPGSATVYVSVHFNKKFISLP